VATSRGVPFVVLTNGTTRTPAELARTLRDIGFGLPDDAVLTRPAAPPRCPAGLGTAGC